MSVKHVTDVSTVVVPNGVKTTKQVLISAEEGPHFAMRRFVMEPGGGMPRHTNTVEHEQYVLGGKARIGIGDEVFEVQKGDVIFIPADVPHWYQNIGNEPFEFLCIVPNLPDTTTLLEESSC
ncbi:MAG: cupin domain-containing protein [Anaerolineales bacterium]|nr:cupin domain-containing protein [Anaerolineales bacterium]MCX7753867.1 cupin domain-containing protein [Anaerolineales bacterium]MDW8277250.1 cupin domain-containing protein [Anaerolineales bacterium]